MIYIETRLTRAGRLPLLKSAGLVIRQISLYYTGVSHMCSDCGVEWGTLPRGGSLFGSLEMRRTCVLIWRTLETSSLWRERDTDSVSGDKTGILV